MPKMAELAGVAHNIAHHAASGLSFLSPHLAQALRGAGEETTAIELLVQILIPPRLGSCSRSGWLLLRFKQRYKGCFKNMVSTKMTFSRLCCTPCPHPGIEMARAMYYTRGLLSLPKVVVCMTLAGCNQSEEHAFL